MTLVPPADAAIGADAPVPPVPPESLNDSASDDQPVDIPAPVLPPAPPVPDASGTTTAFIFAPFQIAEFVSGVAGWDSITQAGTAGPASSIAAVIAAGVASGITIESR